MTKEQREQIERKKAALALELRASIRQELDSQHPPEAVEAWRKLLGTAFFDQTKEQLLWLETPLPEGEA